LPQAGKIKSLWQTCEISGCVVKELRRGRPQRLLHLFQDITKPIWLFTQFG
jgi:hypothetical protein